MKTKTRRRQPEIVLRKGKPDSVILDINDYREMLERLEDADDLAMLEQMRKTPLKFKKMIAAA
jgi:PHD/YefM family antitoxin component YafN of YafNO toxin-antitoxin module